MVTGDTDNERTVLEFFRILSTGDLEAIRQTLHDEVTWTPQVKDIPGAGTYHGKKGVCDDFLAPVRGMFAPGDPKTTVKTIVSKGALVMCESEGLGKLAGRAHVSTIATRGRLRCGTGRSLRFASTWIATTSPSCLEWADESGSVRAVRLHFGSRTGARALGGASPGEVRSSGRRRRYRRRDVR